MTFTPSRTCVSRLRLRAVLLFLCAPALIAIESSCTRDAPHSNPLDPENPNYSAHQRLTGIVTGIYPPYSPVPGALVAMPDLGRLAATDLNGHFNLPDVPPGAYTVYASKQGYRPDSLRVEVSGHAAPDPLLFRLDALPEIRNCLLTTSHISRWWPPDDLYVLTAVASVGDPDGPGDLVAVWLECDAVGVIDTLTYSSKYRAFATEVLERELPNRSLESLQGHAFRIRASDRLRATASSEALHISRIIEATPVLESPQGYVEAPPRPWLRWRPVSVRFPFTWSVEVVRLESGLTLPAWRADGLPSDSTQVRVPQPLASGGYYWAVWIVDEWGNRSRSKEGAFRVP